MEAVVVYESLWGNTRAVARAIAEGIGPEARAFSTAEASPDRVADVDLIVAGAPLQAFSLPGDRIRAGIDPAKTAVAPDLSAPTLRSWLERLPDGHGRSAAFETKIRWSPGSATKTIEQELTKAGYPSLVKAEHFIVQGTEGPLRDGELDRARDWGASLVSAMAALLVSHRG